MAFNSAIISSAAKAQIVPFCGQSPDPRELMIEDLNEEAGAMQTQFAKALAVFQEKQAVLTTTVQSITKKNEELQSAYIASEAQVKELELMHQSELKTLKENQEQQAKMQMEKLQKMLEKCEKIIHQQKQLPPCFEASMWKTQLKIDGNFYISGGFYGAGYVSDHLKKAMGKVDNSNKERTNRNSHEIISLFTEETTHEASIIQSELRSMKEDLEKLVKK